MNLLVIDDEISLRRTLRLTLESMNHRVAEAGSGHVALALIAEGAFDLILLDVRLGRESGIDLLPKLLEAAPGVGIVVMTAFAAIDSAVAAMRAGAFDYLPKPFTPDQLRLLLARWQEVRGLRSEVRQLREEAAAGRSSGDLTTDEPAMAAVLDIAFRVASSDVTVLMRGESGTGKGILARAIHERSERAAEPFVVVHCPSLSAELLESELFGHARGAFTGAVGATEGKVAAAEGGTLFLDEIGDLPTAMQPKLLRFLQDRTFERVGETKARTGDVRLIAATNRNLEADVASGVFREDLLYRLNVIELTLPPLRERPRDLLRLANHLLKQFARQTGRPSVRLTAEAEAAILRHRWPGNLRELRNAIERGVILSIDDRVGLADLPPMLASPPKAGKIQIGSPVSLEALEAEHIRLVLISAPSLDDAAAVLRIDSSTLYRKRRKLGL